MSSELLGIREERLKTFFEVVDDGKTFSFHSNTFFLSLHTLQSFDYNSKLVKIYVCIIGIFQNCATNKKA